jgi:hypothetical protein
MLSRGYLLRAADAPLICFPRGGGYKDNYAENRPKGLVMLIFSAVFTIYGRWLPNLKVLEQHAQNSLGIRSMTTAMMKAMVFEGPGQPLRACERPMLVPEGPDLLLEVCACGVCRTDLHVADG